MNKRNNHWKECKDLLLRSLEDLTRETDDSKRFFTSEEIYKTAIEIISKDVAREYGEGTDLAPAGGRYFIRQPIPDTEELPPAQPLRIRRGLGIFECEWYSQTAEKWYMRGYRRINVTDKIAIPGQNEFRGMVDALRMENKVDFVFLGNYYAFRALPNKTSLPEA